MENPHETHESTTDPDARLARKSRGTASIVGYLGSVLMDNRHGLIVATDVRAPGYDRERDAALEMLTTLDPRARRRTLGADNGYDTPTFVEGVRACGGTPRVAQNVHARKSRSAIDERTTRHDGYAVSQQQRKLVEESLGWGKAASCIIAEGAASIACFASCTRPTTLYASAPCSDAQRVRHAWRRAVRPPRRGRTGATGNPRARAPHDRVRVAKNVSRATELRASTTFPTPR